MYDLPTSTSDPQQWHRGSVLRIGSFGAVRPLKNLLTAGAAAIQISSRLKADLEFHISAGRAEGGGDTILRALVAMYNLLPNAEIVHDGWASWSAFRRLVRNMHLLIQPSYTESFSMVSADGIAEGVPVVGSDAIDWLPPSWIASNDDASNIADVGTQLLFVPNVIKAGIAALNRHNAHGLRSWSKILLGG